MTYANINISAGWPLALGLAGVARSAPSARRLLVVNLAACLLLLVQYLVGMVANLDVTLPAHHPGANASNYLAGSAPAWAG